MPGGDRTGPRGEGPLTGWGRGYCRGGEPNWWGRGRGGGWGFRSGRGRGGWGFRGGRGWGWRGGADYDYAPPSRETELAWLRDEVRHTETVLADLQKRIADLEKADA